ncbi:hypothetical protein JX266_008579 [Neoarthrinium moseri]|nr:hypothetical protein JX266_008579 [Neoarthrinium moseri]
MSWFSSLLLTLFIVSLVSAQAPAALRIYDASTTYRYAGCWNETTGIAGSSGARALAGGISQDFPLNGPMTVETCLDLCAHGQGAPYRLAGVEYSRQCWCANRLSSLSARLPDAACDLPCDGDRTLACGGSLKLGLYNLTESGKNGAVRAGGVGSAAVAMGVVVAGVVMMVGL